MEHLSASGTASMTDAAFISAIAAVFSAIATFLAIIVTWLVYQGQKTLAERTNVLHETLAVKGNELQQALANKDAELQQALANKDAELQRAIAKQNSDLQQAIGKQNSALQQAIAEQDRLQTQRSNLLPLWEYLHALREIDPRKPILPDVIRAVNTLELVALCYEAEVVDPQVLRRTFRQHFMKFYEQIEQCVSLPGTHKTGRDYLNENKATLHLYSILKEEDRTQDKVKSLRTQG